MGSQSHARFSALWWLALAAVNYVQALGLWAVTQRTAVLPNAISYNAVISACRKGQQWQQMQQTAGLPNVISCSTAVSSCEKGQQRQQALGLLAMMRRLLFCLMSFPTQLPSMLAKKASPFGIGAAN